VTAALSEADLLLVRRCQSNDVAAFNEIVSRYKNRVYSFISRMIGPGEDAEDLTQEVFVKAYINIRSFQSRASLNTWLFRIATNICIDHQRRRRRGGIGTVSMTHDDRNDDSDGERELPDDRFEPARLLLNSELGARIEEALQTLPEKMRTVVLLYDIEGLPYEEISQIVDCPLGTVKSRLFNARVALRDKLKDYLEMMPSPASAGAVKGKVQHEL
jgi:RNA polymerase sigma-70 factor (ECF subfamily)